MKTEQLTGSMQGIFRVEDAHCAGYGETLLEAQGELRKAIKMNSRRQAYRMKRGK